jgi:polar amino acid transport system substrate-binding protein
MKRITVIAAAALALWTAAGVQARPFDAIQKEGTLRLATEGYYAPFAHFEGKQLTGFEVELAQMMAGRMGVKYEWKTISFDALLTGLQQDRWDLVISRTASRPSARRP